MCYVCLKDNLLDVADEFAKKFASKHVGKLQAKAIYIKQALRVLDTNDEGKCEVGNAMVERLREEQYNLAKQM